MKILVAFSLDTDLTMGPREMDKRGIPSQVRPERTPAILAKMLRLGGAFEDGPLKGFRIEGSNASGGYTLRDGANAVWATIKANGVFEVIWNDHTLHSAHISLVWTQQAERWLLAFVDDLKFSSDRPTIRRMFLGWLKDLGFQKTAIPALYEGAPNLEKELEQVINALPEGNWTTWRAEEYGNE